MKSFNYVGVNSDSKLTLRDHIDYITNKLNRLSGINIEVGVIHLINAHFSSFVESIITYGLLVYARAAKTIFEKFEKTQKKLQPAIVLENKYEDVDPIVKRGSVVTVFELYVMEVSGNIFKQLKIESAPCFQNEIDLCH